MQTAAESSMKEDCRATNPVLRLGPISVNRYQVGVGEDMRQEAALDLYRESRGLRQEGKIRSFVFCYTNTCIIIIIE